MFCLLSCSLDSSHATKEDRHENMLLKQTSDKALMESGVQDRQTPLANPLAGAGRLSTKLDLSSTPYENSLYLSTCVIPCHIQSIVQRLRTEGRCNRKISRSNYEDREFWSICRFKHPSVDIRLILFQYSKGFFAKHIYGCK